MSSSPNATVFSYATMAADSLPRERYPSAGLAGVLTYMGWARRAIAAGDIQRAHTSLIAAQQIVAVLRGSLERQADPALVERLDGLYAFVQENLARANLDKSDAPLLAIAPVVASLRETWDEAADRALSGGGA